MMKVYLLGALFLLVVHQAAAQGLFGSRAAGGGEPAEGAEGAGGAGGEGGGTNPGGIFSALLGGSAGGGGEGGEGGGTKPGGIFSALLGGSAGGGGEGGEAAEGGAPGPRNPMQNVLLAYLMEQRMQRMQQMQQMKRMQQIQRIREAQRMLQGLARGDPYNHDHFSWAGALMRAYVLDRVFELIGSE